MTKFLNKWFRKFHRWLAVPTAILIPVAVIFRLSGFGKIFPPQLEQIQSILILILAVTGAYLFLVPYIAKWQRKNRMKKQKAAKQAVTTK